MEEDVYCYVVDTVEYEDGRLHQTGSGPNFQGGLVTLASCKHHMRTFSAILPGVWIAGFTNTKVMGRNRLFYLMRVRETFASHTEFWFSQSIPEEAKVSKAADHDRFGDIYRPRESGDLPYSPLSYFEPCKNHVHCELEDWKKDVNYSQDGRRPKLLVGDPEYSFLWERIRITSPRGIGRGQRNWKIADLF